MGPTSIRNLTWGSETSTKHSPAGFYNEFWRLCRKDRHTDTPLQNLIHLLKMPENSFTGVFFGLNKKINEKFFWTTWNLGILLMSNNVPLLAGASAGFWPRWGGEGLNREKCKLISCISLYF